jgi:uracil-DNA glycosylase family 4
VRVAAEPGDEREALRALVGQLRTNLAARGRSGLLGAVVGSRPAAKPPGGVARAAIEPIKAGTLGGSQTPREERGRAELALAHAGTAATTADSGISGAGAATGAVGLQMLREEIGDCQRCKLAGGRTNIVYGVGNPDADLVFVGEAPGADEDARGEPFVGKAGQLLTKMIEAMGYRRQDVYICNVLKCRPPGNRNPEPDEVASCEPFLKRQLAALRPRMIVALGKFAVQCLLRDDAPISRLRGNFRSYEGIPLMPTFHPAYLLRDPSKKKPAWEDLKAVNAALARVGINPPNPPAP